MAYCTADDVIDRISAAGLVYVADDDGSGSVTADEESASVSAAISSASAEIDLALAPVALLPITASNEWLRHRAVDLAAERLAERKGQSVPFSLAEAAKRTRAWLEEVRTGRRRVPGLARPSAADGRSATEALPRVVNPAVPEEGSTWPSPS